MHLQRPDGGDQNHHVGPQARVAALDVEELLHADVGPEPGLRHCGAGKDARVRERGERQVGFVYDMQSTGAALWIYG